MDANKFQKTWASGGTQVGVSSLTLHPSYTVDSQGVPDNDVGVWHLATAIPTSSTIGYATLPASGSDPAAGTTLTVAGWYVYLLPFSQED